MADTPYFLFQPFSIEPRELFAPFMPSTKRDLEDEREFELVRSALVLHHQILPLLAGQKTDLSFSTARFNNTTSDATVSDQEGQKIQYRFHSDLTSLSKKEADYQTRLDDVTDKDPFLDEGDPIKFASRYSLNLDKYHIQSTVSPDGGNLSKIDSTIDFANKSIHTVITDKQGAETQRFDSQMTYEKPSEQKTDMIESQFRDSASHTIKTLACSVRETAEGDYKMSCQHIR